MATIDYILIGGGDQGRVTADTIQSCGYRVVKVFDTRLCEPLPGLVSSGDYNSENCPTGNVLISIGDNLSRKKYADVVKKPFGSIIHPTAIIAKNVPIGEGSVVLHGAIVQINASIGKHVILNTRASVDHDGHIGDFVHLAPGAVLCGRVTVGEGSVIGAGAVILAGVTIGKWATIGAGAVITADVADGEVVVGNSSRVIKVNPLPQ